MSKVVLVIASPLILLSLLVPGPVGGWIFALSSAALPAAVIALGRRRKSRTGSRALGVLALLLVGGTLAILLLAQLSPEPRILALPASLVVMLVVLWILPLILTCWAYSVDFGGSGLREEDLKRLRQVRRQAEERGGEPKAFGAPWNS